MPGSVLGLGVRLSATDAMSGPVRRATGALGGLTEQTRHAMQQLGGFQRTAGLAATAVGAGMTGAVGLAVGQAAELEDTMLSIQQKTNLADETIAAMSDSFLQLSASLPLSAQELAKVGVIAGQLGIGDQAGIEQLAFQAAQLARASDLSEESGAAAMAKLSNIFGIGIDKANQLGSSMVRLANTTTANASTIFEVTKRFGGLAHNMGITVAEANALSATLIDAGVNAEAGGSAMAKILGAATSRADAFAKQMGITSAEFQRSFNEDAIGTLERFFASFQGIDRFEVQEKLKEMGLSGVRVQAAVFGLANQTEKLRRNLNNSTQAYEDGTAMFEAFEAMTKSLTAKLDTFFGSLKNVAIAIGNTLIPFVKMAVDFGTELLSIFLAMPTPVKFLVGVIGAAAGAFVLLAGAGVALMGMMAMLHVGMLNYAAAAGISTASSGILGLSWQLMTHQLAALWAAMSGALASMAGWVIATWSSVAASAAGATGFAAVGAAATAAGSAIWAALSPLLPVILGVAAAVGVLYLAWKVLKPVVGAAFDAIGTLTKPVFAALERGDELAGVLLDPVELRALKPSHGAALHPEHLLLRRR